MPPISPRVWKPDAGYRPASVPMSYARGPAVTKRLASRRSVVESSSVAAAATEGASSASAARTTTVTLNMACRCPTRAGGNH